MKDKQKIKLGKRNKLNKVTLSDDERLNLLANLIIDRILEDKKNGVLKFTK